MSLEQLRRSAELTPRAPSHSCLGMSTFPRRRFLAQTSATLAGSAFTGRPVSADTQGPPELSATPPVIVSTWSFGKPANEAALATIHRGGTGLDAVEQGI